MTGSPVGSEDIGVNLLWLVPGVVGGTERSTVELLRALADTTGGPTIRLYGTADVFAAHPDLRDAFPTTVAPGSLAARPARVGVEASWLAWATRHHRLVHHVGGVVPPARSTPTVLTLHDIQPLEHPERFGAVKRRWLASRIPASVRAARVVCVPSRFTADRVVDHLDVDPDRIRVVPHAIPGAFDRGADEASPDPSQAPLGGAPFVLYPAITHAHKGHRWLVDAVARWPDDLHLVLPGGVGDVEHEVRRAIDASPASSRIHRLGRVDDRALEHWFRHAEAVVIPSEYEGFGLPAAEAMGRGVPVVARSGDAVAEVVGDAGVLLDDMTPASIAAAVARVRDDRAHLVAIGRQRVARFTPAAIAAVQIGAYRDALAGPWPDTTQPAPSPITRPVA